MPGIRAWLKQWFGGEPGWFPPASSSYLLSMPGNEPSPYTLRAGLTSSVLMATLFWLMRSAPEAQLVVREQTRGTKEPTVVPRHPLVTLVGRPNAYYAGEALWMATMLMWGVFGNAYWRIVATRGGEPRELWWVPNWLMTPEGTARELITHYHYTPTGAGAVAMDLPPDQVIHFRHGLDPENPRLGLSPIASVLREIWTDNESTDWVAALLHNMAVPGLVITPKGDSSLSPDEVERVKRYISARFTGEHRGEPLALGAPTDVQKIAHSPSEMDMTTVHNTAEERVTAVLGVPAAVVGFGTGLENSKVGATMREFVGLAWSNGLIPPQRVMASEIERTLLPRFETRLDRFGVGWDYSRVQALQEDENTKFDRYNGGVAAGWVKVSEARAAVNLPVSPDDEIYLRSTSVQAVDPTDQLPEPLLMRAPLRVLPGGTNNGQSEGQGENQEEEGEASSYAGGFEAKQGSLEEFINGQIARHAERLETIPPQLLRLATRQWRREEALQPRFQREIVRVLRRYGEAAALAARELLTTKQTLQDLVNASIIIERMPMLSIKADLEQVYQALYEDMFRLTEELMVVAAGAALTNVSRIQNVLLNAAHERAGLLDLTQDARGAILRSLEEARTQGMTEDAMIDLIRDAVPRGRWLSVETRARILVRSETRYSGNLAIAQSAEQMGARILILDARLGPTDAECLPAGTAVVAINPEKALRRWFEGDLIDICTADGRFLSATGNHPILTRDGWVPAAMLKEGDEIVCCLDAQRLAMDSTSQSSPDDGDMPPSRQQSVDLSEVPLAASTECQAFSAGDFNRQGCNRQVDVIASERTLRNRDNASIMQPSPQELFIGAIESAADFSPKSRFDDRDAALCATANGRMGCLSDSKTLFTSGCTVHEMSRLGLRSQSMTSFLECVPDMSGTQIEMLGEIIKGGATTVHRPRTRYIKRLEQVSPLDTTRPQDTEYGVLADIENGRQLYRTLSREVTCDKIISIDIRPFQGHVYNLRTRDGWYVANSIITHNCEMRNGWIVTPPEAQALAGIEHPNGTLSSLIISPQVVQSGAVIPGAGEG